MARSKGEDRGIFERPKGSDVWWVEHYDCHGQRHREKGGTKTQARNLYQVRQAEKLRGKLPASARPKLTLRQLAAKYVEEAKAGKKPKVIAGELVHQKAWLEKLGDRDVCELRAGDIEAEKGRWLSDLAPATVNRRLAWLKTLFNRAVRDGLVEVSPLGQKRVKMLREAPPRDRLISPEEERALLVQLEAQHGAEMARAFTVALYTGLRQAEQFQGVRRDVDLARSLLRVPDAKGGGRQWVELSPKAAEALRAQLASHRSRWIWPGENPGVHLVEDTAYDRLKAAAKKLELAPGIVWHTCRHTYISRLCMLGVPITTVQKLARHKSIQMTIRYAHYCPDHSRQALLQLDGFSGEHPQSEPPPEPPPEPLPGSGTA